MRQQDTTYYSSDDTTACQSPDREHCEYMYCDAGHPNGYIYGSATDGKNMTLKISCDEVANYRPWSTTPAPVTAGAANGITLRSRPQGYTMKVRYLARLPWNGYYFVMAHDPDNQLAGQGNWVFMPAGCFAASEILSPNP